MLGLKLIHACKRAHCSAAVCDSAEYKVAWYKFHSAQPGHRSVSQHLVGGNKYPRGHTIFNRNVRTGPRQDTYITSYLHEVFIHQTSFCFILSALVYLHTAHPIVSWPNPKQRVIVHTFGSMMMIRQGIYILSIITWEMGKLKTHSPTLYNE